MASIVSDNPPKQADNTKLISPHFCSLLNVKCMPPTYSDCSGREPAPKDCGRREVGPPGRRACQLPFQPWPSITESKASGSPNPIPCLVLISSRSHPTGLSPSTCSLTLTGTHTELASELLVALQGSFKVHRSLLAGVTSTYLLTSFFPHTPSNAAYSAACSRTTVCR